VRLFPEDGFGFLEAPDGREVYFHRNSVLEGFETLEVGSEVRFAEEQGIEGPQASTVSLVGKGD
jgi:cold shock CspA family protein